MHIPFLIEKVKERRPDGSLVYLREIETLHQNRQILTNMYNVEDISKIHMILASKHLLYMVSENTPLIALSFNLLALL